MSWVAAAVVGGAVIGGATSIYAANKSAGAAKDATGATVAENARQYDQTRADFAPYRDVGRGALGSLADIYGIARPAEDLSVGSKAYQAAFQEWLPRYNGEKGSTTGFEKAQRAFADIWQRGVATGRYGAGAPPGGYPQNPDGSYGPAPGTTGTAPAGAPVDRTGGFYASPGYQFRVAEGTKAIQNSAAARGKLFSGQALKAVEGYAQGVASDEFARHVAGLQSLAGVGQSATGSTATAGANAAASNSAAYQNQGSVIGSSYMNGAAGVNNAVQGGISNWLLSRYLKPA